MTVLEADGPILRASSLRPKGGLGSFWKLIFQHCLKAWGCNLDNLLEAVDDRQCGLLLELHKMHCVGVTRAFHYGRGLITPFYRFPKIQSLGLRNNVKWSFVSQDFQCFWHLFRPLYMGIRFRLLRK